MIIRKEFKHELPVGVCHPGVHSPQTGLVKNAPNCYWLEKKPFQNDLRKALGKRFFVKMMLIVLHYQKLLMVQVNIIKLFMVLF